MKDLKVGINAGHLIQKAVNSKNLGALAKEEDKREILDATGTTVQYKSPVDTRTLGQKYLFYSKENLEALKKSVEGKTPEEILELMGVRTYTFDDGSKMISGYHAPTSWCTYKTLGIDESELLKGVKRIQGNCDLTGSYLKNLAGVEEVTGKLTVPIFSHVEDLSSLKKVGYIACEAADKGTVSDVLSKLNLKCITSGINNFYRGFLKQPFKDVLSSFMASGAYKTIV